MWKHWNNGQLLENLCGKGTKTNTKHSKNNLIFERVISMTIYLNIDAPTANPLESLTVILHLNQIMLMNIFVKQFGSEGAH